MKIELTKEQFDTLVTELHRLEGYQYNDDSVSMAESCSKVLSIIEDQENKEVVEPKICERCGGKGKIHSKARANDICSSCYDEGCDKSWREASCTIVDCGACNGTGIIVENQTVRPYDRFGEIWKVK